MKSLGLIALLGACGPNAPTALTATTVEALPAGHPATTLDTNVKARRRMLPPEAFLRAYMMWFGGLAPLDVMKRGGTLFERWEDYIAALGLPDYAHEFPRITQSNTMMLAAVERLAEVLCIRAAEHDFPEGVAPDQRLVFGFSDKARPSRDEFAERFDVLHRMFIGYPVALAPTGRVEDFYALYNQVAANHATPTTLTASETGWVAVCTALVIHPEAELY